MKTSELRQLKDQILNNKLVRKESKSAVEDASKYFSGNSKDSIKHYSKMGLYDGAEDIESLVDALVCLIMLYLEKIWASYEDESIGRRINDVCISPALRKIYLRKNSIENVCIRVATEISYNGSNTCAACDTYFIDFKVIDALTVQTTYAFSHLRASVHSISHQLDLSDSEVFDIMLGIANNMKNRFGQTN